MDSGLRKWDFTRGSQDLHREWGNPGGQEGHTHGEAAPYNGPVWTPGIRGCWQCPSHQTVYSTP